MQKILHFIRQCAICFPGGGKLVHCVLGLLARRAKAKRCARLQRVGFEICNLIHNTLSQHKIAYFADHGTMLGIIRENGFIKHDEDMDFSIPPNVSLSQVWKALSPCGFSIVHGFAINGHLEEITLGYQGLTIDFFQCHAIGEKLGHYVFVSHYDHRTGNLLKVMAHERIRPPLQGLESKIFGELRKAQVALPINAVEYLTASYGNWQVPDSKSDFSSDKIPTQYRDICDGCEALDPSQTFQTFQTKIMV